MISKLTATHTKIYNIYLCLKNLDLNLSEIDKWLARDINKWLGDCDFNWSDFNWSVFESCVQIFYNIDIGMNIFMVGEIPRRRVLC